MKSTEMLFTAVLLLLICIFGGINSQQTCTHLISTALLPFFTMLPTTSLKVNTTDDSEPPNRTILKIKAGVDAGKSIFEVLQSETTSKDNFFAEIGKISKKVAPFLGAIGSIFGFMDFFIPKGPSLEMQYMVQRFAEMDQRFDELSIKIDDVENLIIKEAMRVQYGNYEAMVHSLSERLHMIIDAKSRNLSKSIYEIRKQTFIKEFDKVSLHEALDAMYLGLTEKSTFLIDITDAGRRFSFDDRKIVQSVMKSVLHLIFKGVKVMIAYDLLQGNSTAFESGHNVPLNASRIDYLSELKVSSTGAKDTINEWIAKIKEIVSHMQTIDKEVKKKWEDQMKADVSKILTLKKGLSNEDFADYLYNYLKSKYDWRNWYVVVYNAVSGDEQHYVQKTYGESTRIAYLWAHYHTSFGEKNRNVIISSDLEGKSKPINSDYVKRVINNLEYTWIQTIRISDTENSYVTRYYDAHHIYDQLHLNMKNIPCDDSAFFNTGTGVIKKSADPAYRAPEGHYVIQDGGKYKVHVFGHCVHWWVDTPSGRVPIPQDEMDNYDKSTSDIGQPINKGSEQSI